VRHAGFGGVSLAPYTAWLALAAKSAEMLAASSQVIQHRVGRMILSGPSPSAADRREFEVMGTEKITAGLDASRAMAAHMLAANGNLWRQVFQAQLAMAAAWTSLAGSRTTGQALARQAHLARVMTRSQATAGRAAHSMASLAHRGLAPIHARATANARRLARR